jgi:hypothetical protein
MKTKIASMLVVLFITTSAQLWGQRNIKVEAYNNDISYNLDLQAVASLFGDSKDLEDFEYRLNDYDSQISNLDLNSDGQVDYLRVIETSENNVHLIVIQAVLDRDVFQDVASIVVERDRYRKSYIQIIGDPYMYGSNYIIEPYYYRTPFIVSWFWTTRYRSYFSPYYYGYYPRYYRYRHPLEINIYLTKIHRHINYDHHYRYTETRRNNYSSQLHNTIGRNDYGTRYPERTFSQRNNNSRNREDMDRRYQSNKDGSRFNKSDESDNRRISSGSKTERGSRSSNDDIYNGSRNDSRNTNGSRNSKDNTYSRPSNDNRVNGSRNQNTEGKSNIENSTINKRGTNNENSGSRNNSYNQRETEQSRSTRVTAPESRRNTETPAPRVNRESNNRESAPARTTEQKVESRSSERKAEPSRSESKSTNNARSDNKNDSKSDNRSDSRR